MTKHFTILLSVFMFALDIYGQYQPMAVEGAHWVVFALTDNGPAHHAIVVRGDTLIDGTPYKKVFRREITNGATTTSEFLPPYYFGQEILVGAIRDNAAEEAVYGVGFVPDAWHFEDCNIFEEQLMYNFSSSVGDTVISCLHSASGLPNAIIDSIGYEMLFGIEREVQYTSLGPLIEGVGTWMGPFVPVYSNPVPGNPVLLIDYCVGTDDECGFLPSSTTELPFETIAHVYPNPANNKITIELKSAFPQHTIARIYGDDGRLYQTCQIVYPSLVKEIDVDYLPCGTYILVIENNKMKSATTIIVAR